MAVNPIVDSRDVRFVVFEMLETDKLTKYDHYSDFDKDMFEDVLDLAESIAVEKVYPANAEGDKNPVTYDPDTKEVRIPEAYFEGLDAYYDAGFLGIMIPQEYGGMGMPAVMYNAVTEYFTAASTAFSMYPALSIGAANLIINFYEGDDKDVILEKMLSGEWGGTMCLTEAEAGSDVGALTTKAKRKEEKDFIIIGNKIWISSGENNYYKNMIHPVLARIEGDPEGTKGISIFMTPKINFDTSGNLQDENDVICTGIEHKMGINGSATCMLAFGDEEKCTGKLLGQEKKGMRIMFQMMNEARLYVGLQGQAVASAAYMHAATFAKTRIQGVHVTQMMNPEATKVAIIEHPDVKRMLLGMKSKVEAMRSLVYFCGYIHDRIETAESEDDKKEFQGLLDFLIPITKAGNTDMAWEVTGEAVQVYGGYGYSSDYPVEQYARDSKILSIYEGTNGIQAMDLTMRKLLMNENQYNYSVYQKHFRQTIDKAKGVVDDRYVDAMEKALAKMDETVEHLKKQMAEGKFLHLFADATPLQRALTMLTYAWMHLWAMTIATPKMKELVGDKKGAEREEFLNDNFEAAYYSGRVLSAQFYIGKEFPTFFSMCDAILDGESALLKTGLSTFSASPEE